MVSPTCWMTTYSGIRFNPLEPDPNLINMADIAHGLSLTCRFSGQCNKFYSVAEHSVRLALIVPKSMRSMALMHDAAEAYLTDVSKLVKNNLPCYQEAEKKLLIVILDKYNVEPESMEIKPYEYQLLAQECRDLGVNTTMWHLPLPPSPVRLDPWNPEFAEHIFLALVDILGIGLV